MRALRCILGNHKYVERHRVIVKETTWYKTDRYGTKITGSEYQRKHTIVIKECARDNCDHQIAYRCLVDPDGTDNDIVSIHIEFAKEEMFVDKV